MGLTGFYINSKNKSNISYKMHKPSDKENFSKTIHESLRGPGRYETNLSSHGKQLLAKNKS